MLGATMEQIAGLLRGPTSLSTLAYGLPILICVVFYAVFRSIFPSDRVKRPTRSKAVAAISAGLQHIDQLVTSRGPHVVGTAQAHPTLRILRVFISLLSIATLSAVLPAPLGLLFTVLGLVAAIAVFRHRAVDAQKSRELASQLKVIRDEDRIIPINGSLIFETLIACLFIPLLASVAFAQLYEAGLGFHVPSNATPYAFTLYAWLELMKAGSMVDYYDLLSGRLPFERLSEVKHADGVTIAIVLFYRLTLNILLFGAIKSVIDAFQAQSKGIDLAAILWTLEAGTEDERIASLEILELSAKDGQPNALQLLKVHAKRKPSDRLEERVRIEAIRSIAKVAQHLAPTSVEAAGALLDELPSSYRGWEWLHAQKEIGIAWRKRAVRRSAADDRRKLLEYLRKSTAALDAARYAITNSDLKVNPVDHAHLLLEDGFTRRAEIDLEPELHPQLRQKLEIARDTFKQACAKFEAAKSLNVEYARALIERNDLNVMLIRIGAKLRHEDALKQLDTAIELLVDLASRRGPRHADRRMAQQLLERARVNRARLQKLTPPVAAAA